MVKIEKFHVCVDCQTVGISNPNCICCQSNNYPTIELEFEVCECCGQVKYQPLESEFNDKQLEKQ